MSDRPEPNKQTALDFYDLMFNQCRPADAIEKYAGTPTSSTTRRWPMASRRSSTTSSGQRTTTPGSGPSSSGRLPTVTM